MKRKISIFLAYCLLCAVFGCASHRSDTGSFDALSTTYGADAQAFAAQIAHELGTRYAPAHTPLVLHRAPGVFGDLLEQKLRAAGFALASSGVGVSYTLDVLENEGAPLLGYAQVSCSDGQLFSFTREIFSGTALPLAEPAPDEYPLQSRSLPETPTAANTATPAQRTVLPAPPASAPPPAVKAYPVRRQDTATNIAKRNRIPVADFCRWNGVHANADVPKGRMVYLSEPPAPETPPMAIPAAASVPAPQETKAQAAIPAPAPPTVMPTARQTSPALFPPETAAPVVAPPPSPVVPVVAPSAPLPDTPPEPLPEPLPPQWEITKGRMLRAQMEGWAAVAGYSLIWNAQNDYEMQSSATFAGVFIDAVKHFFAALQANGLALRVTIYQGNNVMEVSEH